MGKRTLRRKITLGLICVLIVAALVVVFLPNLINRGLGKARFEDSIARHINGDATIQTLGLRWFGGQTVQGLGIVDLQGEAVADLDVRIEEGLWTLLTRGLSTLHFEVTGDADAVLEENGRLSLVDLIKRDEPSDPDDSSFMSELELMQVAIRDLEIRLHDEAADRIVTIQGLDGALRYESGAPWSLDLDASVIDGPTELLDTLLGMDGLLLSAAGPTLSMTCTARRFSTQGGSFTGEVLAPNARLSFDLAGGDDLLKTAEPGGIEGELRITPELTRHALFRITPILGDIRVAFEPIRFTIREAGIPLDGDLSRLSADVNIEIGPVRLDAGASSLSLLAIFDPDASATVAGEIKPIHARIADGAIRYDEFSVTIDKFDFPFSGTVDLIRKRIDMRTMAPMAGLATSIRELRGIAPSIKVPILIRGPFGEIKSEFDPDFRLDQAVLDMGIFKLLTDLLEKNDDPLLQQLLEGSQPESGKPFNPLGDLLNDLLGGDRKNRDGTPGG